MRHLPHRCGYCGGNLPSICGTKPRHLSNTTTKRSSVNALLKAYDRRYYLVAANDGKNTEGVRFKIKEVENVESITAMINSPSVHGDIQALLVWPRIIETRSHTTKEELIKCFN